MLDADTQATARQHKTTMASDSEKQTIEAGIKDREEAITRTVEKAVQDLEALARKAYDKAMEETSAYSRSNPPGAGRGCRQLCACCYLVECGAFCA